MLTKKSADTLPAKYMYSRYPNILTVDVWLDGEWKNAGSEMFVSSSHFLVDPQTRHLYVARNAEGSVGPRWLAPHNVRLIRVHDGWLSAEFHDDAKFAIDKVGENRKLYRLVNMLYSIQKLDTKVGGWWENK